MEKKLLRVTPVGSEMFVRESTQFLHGNARTIVKIKSAQHTLNPDIDGECFPAAIAKKEHAISYLFAYALKLPERFAGLVVRHFRDPFQGNFAGDNLPRREKKMSGAKTKAADPQLLL